MKSLILAIMFALLAPACVVRTRTPELEVSTVAVSVQARRCHPSRYWNGERCVRKGWGHWHRHHYYYYDDD